MYTRLGSKICARRICIRPDITLHELQGPAFTEWDAADRKERALFFLGPAHSGAYFHQVSTARLHSE